MILIDKPYVSELLKTTIKNNHFEFLETTQFLNLDDLPSNITSEKAIQIIKNNINTTIYTNSENTIGWIAKNLNFTDLPEKIDLFKNKVKFREMLKKQYPDFYFMEVNPEDILNLDTKLLQFPFVIKPSTGFFSMGVHKVNNLDEWKEVSAKLTLELKKVKDIYPAEVMNINSFIIEQCLKGEEYAVDAYFNDLGEPVITGIYKHLFSGDEDVSDRVYITSKDIIENNLESFTNFLKITGKLSGIKNFPAHTELIKDKDGNITPVEINPMRFGGWCTTADMTYHAYGFNPYEYYFSNKSPDWNSLLKDLDNIIYSIVVLDNSTGVTENEIKEFDYDKLTSNISNILELRKINFHEYPVFGFIFAKTHKDKMDEIFYLLNSDLNEFIVKK